MARVAVVTDTTHSMPRAVVEELGLHEVSLYVTFDGATERESDIADLADFSTRLSSSSEMPGTSQPPVGDQHIHAPEQAQRLVDRGREIYGGDPEFVSEIGPVIGAHVGPGLLGVAGMQRALLYPRG